jgi:hypothetical protein
MTDQKYNELPENNATVQTGSELYGLGLAWLRTARQAWDSSAGPMDETAHEVSAVGAAAIAQACFAGAHAAAFGQLAADAAYDEGDTKLATGWATAIGARLKDDK